MLRVLAAFALGVACAAPSGHASPAETHEEQSYNIHAKHIRAAAAAGKYGHFKSRRDLEDFFDTDDQRRHFGLLAPVTAFVQPGEQWLTVGDLQLGRDAVFLTRLGADVTASDLDTTLLEVTHSFGLIPRLSLIHI